MLMHKVTSFLVSEKIVGNLLSNIVSVIMGVYRNWPETESFICGLPALLAPTRHIEKVGGHFDLMLQSETDQDVLRDKVTTESLIQSLVHHLASYHSAPMIG